MSFLWSVKSAVAGSAAGKLLGFGGLLSCETRPYCSGGSRELGCQAAVFKLEVTRFQDASLNVWGKAVMSVTTPVF